MLRCHSSAFARYVAARVVSPCRRAKSAAHTRPAISAAIVAGENPATFSQRSWSVRGPLATRKSAERRTWSQSPALAELMVEHDGEGDLVHLQPAEHRLAVQAAVLRERPVGPLLQRPHVVQRPPSPPDIAHGDQRGCDLVQVT